MVYRISLSISDGTCCLLKIYNPFFNHLCFIFTIGQHCMAYNVHHSRLWILIRTHLNDPKTTYFKQISLWSWILELETKDVFISVAPFFTIRMLLAFKISYSPSIFRVKRYCLLCEAVFKLPTYFLKRKKKKKKSPGNSLAIQWLGLVSLTAWVQSLVEEEKNSRSSSQRKKKKKEMRPWEGVRSGVWGPCSLCSVVL